MTAGLDKSIIITTGLTSCFSCNSAASCFNFSSRLPISHSAWCVAASWRANLAPMPLVAPVMTARLVMWGNPLNFLNSYLVIVVYPFRG